MKVREALAADIAAILALWNPVIRDSLATFNSIEKTPDEVRQQIAEQPFFIAEDGDQLLGFTTCFAFRGGPGYAHTKEHTIIVSPRAHGRGVGRALMQQLQTHAMQSGVRSLVAGISATNLGAVRFHEALGFATVARLPQVGRKFDQWIDLILMQKFLQNPADRPDPTR